MKSGFASPDLNPGAWKGLKAGAWGSAEGRKPLGRGSGGVPQQKSPFSRAREKGIKGMGAAPGWQAALWRLQFTCMAFHTRSE